jgi:hypothetical protein
MIRKAETVVCYECGNYFTPTGLSMHAGSEKCRLTKLAKPLKVETTQERERMQAKGKACIAKNVAKAVHSRELSEMCGLEKAKTKLLHTDMSCEVQEEYWVHEWVYRIWEQQNRTGYTRTAYSLLEKLNNMPKDERESEIGLIMLGMYA